MVPVLADLEILARTIWGEARGEGQLGMEAVAAVIVNRVFDPRWPDTIAEVCLQPKQFSCWNKDDPNRGKMLGANFSDIYFRRAYAVAAGAIADLADISRKANHYLAADLFDGPLRPSWADPNKVTNRVGSHVFIRL